MSGPSPWIYDKHIIQAWLVSIFYPPDHKNWFKGGKVIQSKAILKFFDGSIAKQSYFLLLSWDSQKVRTEPPAKVSILSPQHIENLLECKVNTGKS